MLGEVLKSGKAPGRKGLFLNNLDRFLKNVTFLAIFFVIMRYF